MDIVIRHQRSMTLLWVDLMLIGLGCPKVESLALTVNIVDKQPKREKYGPLVNYGHLQKLAEKMLEG